MEKCGAILVIYLIQYAIGQPPCTDPGYTLYNGVCYYFGDVERSWSEAQTDCRGRAPDSDLALITDQSVQDFLQARILSERWDRTWIGLKEERTDWHWVKGNEREQYFEPQGCYLYNYINPTQMSYGVAVGGTFTVAACKEACFRAEKKYAGTVIDQNDAATPLCKCGDDYDWSKAQTGCRTKCHASSSEYCGAVNKIIIYRVNNQALNLWRKDQPNDFDGYQRCMSLNENNYKWADEECGDNYQYMCEYDKRGTDCTTIGDSYYSTQSGKCVSKHETMSNWYKARADCRSRGGDLLRTDSQAAWEFVVSILPQQNKVRWWIAGSSHRWYWSNGAGLSYTNWALAQPDERGEGCACISRNSERQNFQWEDQPCNNRFQYVCQIGSVLATSTVGPSIPTRPTTPTTPTTSTTLTPSSSTASSTVSSTVSSTKSSTVSSSISSTTMSSSSTIVSTTTKPSSTLAPTTRKPTNPPTQPPPPSVASSTSSAAMPSTTTTTSASTSTTTVSTTMKSTMKPTVPSSTTENPDGTGMTTDRNDAGPAAGQGSDAIPKGVIVAIVVAGLAVLVGLVRLIVYCYQRSRRQQKSKTEELIYHEPYDGIKDFENPGYLRSTSEPKKSHKYIKNKAANGTSGSQRSPSPPPSVSSMVVGEAAKPDESVENGSDLVYAY